MPSARFFFSGYGHIEVVAKAHVKSSVTQGSGEFVPLQLGSLRSIRPQAVSLENLQPQYAHFAPSLARPFGEPYLAFRSLFFPRP